MNDWYSSESWYAPLAREEEQQQTAPAAPAKKKKKHTWLWISGGVLLALALIASSLLFSRGSGPQLDDEILPSSPAEDTPEDLPEDKDDFFASFYEKVEGTSTRIGIAQAELPTGYHLELKEASGESMSLQELYRACSDSIVAISGYKDGKSGYNWGTGVILSPDGLILTNTHVIDDCDRATVTLFDDRVLEAKLVGADSISDVALLKIEAKALPVAEFGLSGNLQVGDQVAAIGNPLGETFRCTLTDGIISAIERGINYNGHSMTLLQTNTALNEGNSGGALFNMYGQVIGVTNMKMMSSYSSIEGIAFAIPSSTVREVVNSLVQYGEMRGRPAIGITVGAIPDNAKERYQLPEGLYVSAVSEESDAKEKGIRPGDIITHVNGTPVTTTEEIGAIKNELQVGDIMTFTIWRDGEIIEIDVALVDTNDIYG